MASPLSPVQMVKRASDRLIVSIEDVCELWPIVKEGFESRVPFKRAILNNKARNPVLVEKLPVEYILTTDARLRGRTALEQSPFWFRHPYANIVLVTCEDLDEYRSLLKPRLKQIVQNEEREWFIVFVSRAPANEAATKLIKKAYSRLETDFSSKKRERCCRLETYIMDASVWEDIDTKVLECIRNTLERRVQFYEEEVKRHLECRFMPAWNFSNFFVVKESLAIMFEMAHLIEDALREYDEVDQIYVEIVNAPHLKSKEFGGTDPGDENASILEPSRKPLPQFLLDDSVREFDFRQYLFARQSMLLFNLNRPAEVATRGFPFIISFSKSLLQHERRLPFCLREIWVFTACLSTVKATAEQFNPRSVVPEVEKDFFRLQADLYSYARTKLMRLADLIGYGSRILKSPCNSAALSLLPWPKPAIWPPVPADASERIQAKLQAVSDKQEVLGSTRKELALAPGILLREANRRRASLSSGNLSDLVDFNNNFKGSFKRSDSIVEEGAQGVGWGSGKVIINGSAVFEGPSLLSSPRTAPGSGSTLVHGRLGSPRATSLIPTLSWGAIDNPMKLGEIQAAAEEALLTKSLDKTLQQALSSAEGFEELYVELTKHAANNFHRSWRRRHGVVLDGEVAAVHYSRGDLDSAAKLYEKVCALYAGECWHGLLVEVLPCLSDCQKRLGDWAGYLSSCIKLMSLERGLLSKHEMQSLQSEIVRLAHSGLKSPVSLDVSALITFASKGGPPLELVEGDPGALLVTVWSGFLEDIALESLSLTLMATFSSDEVGKVVKTADAPVLKPGKNSVLILLPPQRPGSYVLGVLTGHIGEVRLRSHTYCYTSAASCKGGPPDSDDYLTFEKPLRPVLEVSKPRSLVTLKAAVSWRLLFGEPQWVGLLIKPMDYSLKGARVTISAGHDLGFDVFQTSQLEAFNSPSCADSSLNVKGDIFESGVPPEAITREDREPMNGNSKNWKATAPIQRTQMMTIKDGQVELPEWASAVPSVLWLRVVANKRDEITGTRNETLLFGYPKSPKCGPILQTPGNNKKNVDTADCFSESPEIVSPRQGSSAGNVVEEIRTLNVKLEFGAARNRVLERAISMQYIQPFCTSTRVVSKGNDGTLLLQVALASEIVATTTIHDVRLELQAGFIHTKESGGKPDPSWLLPLVLSTTSEGAVLFLVQSLSSNVREEVESRLIVHYKIAGDRRLGAHAPVRQVNDHSCDDLKMLTFTSSFVLQVPVLEQLLAVGMLPIPFHAPRVGQQVIFRWRLERLKGGWVKEGSFEPSTKSISGISSSESESELENTEEELVYELLASSETWMIAGRRKGIVQLSQKVSSRVVISMACVPLVAGHVHPPALSLAGISQAHISECPSGPHVVCVLPAVPCSTLCASKIV